MSYDVYYATGGGSLIYGGSDVWVNNWLREVAPKLNHPSKLLIHRRQPKEGVTFDSPIEVVWQSDGPKEFEKLISGCRRLHILHGCVDRECIEGIQSSQYGPLRILI